ncbi:hypothetical protein HPB51_001270 [Rhipicephalus microplus]|uniref:Uncharacterized protein n=1 Tax=Rhipicephalus microplus TaxID=6941 RepID=A0A9J6E600_RHIMP|nr:hypothetical protein HPB51_001270 [Rhipicephalus microplus]
MFASLVSLRANDEGALSKSSNAESYSFAGCEGPQQKHVVRVSCGVSVRVRRRVVFHRRNTSLHPPLPNIKTPNVVHGIFLSYARRKARMVTSKPRLWVRLLPRAALGSLFALSCIALIGQLSPIITYHTQNLAIYVNRGSPSGGPGYRGHGAIGHAYQDAGPVGLPLALYAPEDTEGSFVGRRRSAKVAVKVGKLPSTASVHTLAPQNMTVTREHSWLIEKSSREDQLENGTTSMYGHSSVREPQRLINSQNASRHTNTDAIKVNANKVHRNDTSDKPKVVPNGVVKLGGDKPKVNKTALPRISDSYAVIDPAMKKRILLLAYFRSGSSFLGGLLSSTSNRTFFSYEPLSLLSAAERLNSQTAPRGLEILANHLTCQFPRMSDYLAAAPKRWNHYATNAFLMKLCARKVKVCLNPDFMADVCRRSPVQVIKVTRLSVVQVLQWLRLNAPLRRNLKVAYLVRDPRGMISSRSVMSWCRKSATCKNASSLCREMGEDLDAFEELRELLPDATVRVRYEDIAMSPVTESKALFRALHLDFSAGVTDFLRTHTVANDTKVLQNPYSTFRQSGATAFRWAKKLSWDRVKGIQAACSPILKRLAYKVFRSDIELKKVSLR